jgi:translation initiation factor 2 gamma subunit (eIF-2gamma)
VQGRHAPHHLRQALHVVLRAKAELYRSARAIDRHDVLQAVDDAEHFQHLSRIIPIVLAPGHDALLSLSSFIVSTAALMVAMRAVSPWPVSGCRERTHQWWTVLTSSGGASGVRHRCA